MTEQQGSYDVRGRDLDTVFATSFTSDRCLEALRRTQQRFHPQFPGWELWRMVLTGSPLPVHQRRIEAYAIGMARGLARATKLNGRRVVPLCARRPGWIAQAGRDGLEFALYGKFPCGLGVRAEQFSVRGEGYQRVRDGVAAGIWRGIDNFAGEVKFQYRRLSYAN
jgi:hypothetical protein